LQAAGLQAAGSEEAGSEVVDLEVVELAPVIVQETVDLEVVDLEVMGQPGDQAAQVVFAMGHTVVEAPCHATLELDLEAMEVVQVERHSDSLEAADFAARDSAVMLVARRQAVVMLLAKLAEV